MTEKQITDQILKEYQEFCDALYTGKPVDYRLWSAFLSSLKSIPPSQHKMSATHMIKLIEAGREKLTFLQMGFVLNCINAVPFMYIYPDADLDECLRRHEELEVTLLEYNAVQKAMDSKLARKRDSLLNIGGVSAGNMPKSRILTKA